MSYIKNTDAGLIERICPWNIDEHVGSISTAYNGINYTVHDMEMRRPLAKCKVPEEWNQC